MIFDKQLKVYDTGVFKRSYRRVIVNNELLYVSIECVFQANHHYVSHFIHYIYEYTTDSGPVAMVMPWTSISTSTKNQQTGSYIYSDTKVTLKCMERRSGLYSLFSNIKKSFININKSFININKSFININKSFININKYDEHLLILINDFLIILENQFLILKNHFLILRIHLLILENHLLILENKFLLLRIDFLILRNIVPFLNIY